jgi:light-regulated signal transduction histidine kinase (bacteriophytochrome)
LPHVHVDACLIEQLYQNLIGNAIKFSGGRPPQIHLTAQRAKTGWVFGVRDHGIGIAPEYATMIFAPFKRLHSREAYEGTGIGLAICRKAVERHGGRIWVESTLGEGSHFMFTLG